VTIFIRGLIFLATLTLLGIYGLECFVLWPATSETRIVSKCFSGWARSCLLGLFIATVADLLHRASDMTGGWSLSLRAIHPILFMTHVGHVWIFRGTLLIILLLIENFDMVGLKFLRMSLAVALGITIALTGHAAKQGDFTVATLMDTVHVIAAGLWVGGLFSLTVALRNDLKPISPDTLARIVPRFSTLAGSGLFAVVIGGSYNAWISLPNVAALWSTTYGRILSAKLLAVSILVIFGALNRYRVLPRLKNRQTEAKVLFAEWIKREVWAAVFVLGLTAILCETIPARHAGHTGENSGLSGKKQK